MKNTIKLIIVGIATTISIKLNEYFLKQNLHWLTVIAIASFAGVMFVKIVEYLLFDFPMKYVWLRRLVDEKAKFEGVWIQYLFNLPERHLSIACIEYNHLSGNYRYCGKGLDEKGNLKATWEGVDVIINPGKEEINYFGQGQLFDETAETIMSYGQLKFVKGSHGIYDSGTGFFVDFGTHFFKTKYVMERVKTPVNLFSKHYGFPDNKEIKRIAMEYDSKIKNTIV